MAAQPASQQIPLVDPATGKPTSFGLQFLNQLVNLSNSTAAQISGLDVITGQGSPAGVVTAAPGTLYISTSGGVGKTLWVKESGNGTGGWASK